MVFRPEPGWCQPASATARWQPTLHLLRVPAPFCHSSPQGLAPSWVLGTTCWHPSTSQKPVLIGRAHAPGANHTACLPEMQSGSKHPSPVSVPTSKERMVSLRRARAQKGRSDGLGRWLSTLTPIRIICAVRIQMPGLPMPSESECRGAGSGLLSDV